MVSGRVKMFAAFIFTVLLFSQLAAAVQTTDVYSFPPSTHTGNCIQLLYPADHADFRYAVFAFHIKEIYYDVLKNNSAYVIIGPSEDLWVPPIGIKIEPQDQAGVFKISLARGFPFGESPDFILLSEGDLTDAVIVAQGWFKYDTSVGIVVTGTDGLETTHPAAIADIYILKDKIISQTNYYVPIGPDHQAEDGVFAFCVSAQSGTQAVWEATQDTFTLKLNGQVALVLENKFYWTDYNRYVYFILQFSTSYVPGVVQITKAFFNRPFTTQTFYAFSTYWGIYGGFVTIKGFYYTRSGAVEYSYWTYVTTTITNSGINTIVLLLQNVFTKVYYTTTTTTVLVTTTDPSTGETITTYSTVTLTSTTISYTPTTRITPTGSITFTDLDMRFNTQFVDFLNNPGELPKTFVLAVLFVVMAFVLSIAAYNATRSPTYSLAAFTTMMFLATTFALDVTSTMYQLGLFKVLFMLLIVLLGAIIVYLYSRRGGDV